MFEITFRTEDKATWQKLLGLLGSLDLPLLRKEVPTTNGEAKNASDNAAEMTAPEIIAANDYQSPGSVSSSEKKGGIEFSKEYLELLKNYNPKAGRTMSKDIPAVPIAEWAGWSKGPIPLPEGFNAPLENFKPGFGCMKGMFVMSPDFDEPLEDFKEYMG